MTCTKGNLCEECKAVMTRATNAIGVKLHIFTQKEGWVVAGDLYDTPCQVKVKFKDLLIDNEKYTIREVCSEPKEKEPEFNPFFPFIVKI